MIRRRISRALRSAGAAFFAAADVVDSVPLWRALVEACPQCWRTSDGGICAACGLDTGKLTAELEPDVWACDRCNTAGNVGRDCPFCGRPCRPVYVDSAEVDRHVGPVDMECPVRGCGAGVGDPCTDRGERRRGVHAERWARSAGNRIAIDFEDLIYATPVGAGRPAWDRLGGQR